MLLVTLSPNGEGADWFLDKPLFQAVPAMQDGRFAVQKPDESSDFAAVAWALCMQSPLSLPWVADKLEALANDAFDGGGPPRCHCRSEGDQHR